MLFSSRLGWFISLSKIMQITTITKQQFINGDYQTMNNLDFLSDVLEDFCTKYNLEFMSADDILHHSPTGGESNELTEYQRKWLNNYIQVWDLTQDQGVTT